MIPVDPHVALLAEYRTLQARARFGLDRPEADVERDAERLSGIARAMEETPASTAEGVCAQVAWFAAVHDPASHFAMTLDQLEAFHAVLAEGASGVLAGTA